LCLFVCVRVCVCICVHVRARQRVKVACMGFSAITDQEHNMTCTNEYPAQGTLVHKNGSILRHILREKVCMCVYASVYAYERECVFEGEREKEIRQDTCVTLACATEKTGLGSSSASSPRPSKSPRRPMTHSIVPIVCFAHTHFKVFTASTSSKSALTSHLISRD